MSQKNVLQDIRVKKTSYKICGQKNFLQDIWARKAFDKIYGPEKNVHSMGGEV